MLQLSAMSGRVAMLCSVLILAGLHVAEGAYTDAKPLRFKGKFNPFKVLGLPTSQRLPSNDVLRKAFKKGALQWHPDRCKRKKPAEECEARMEEVHLAQEVLSDERKLQQWEAWDEDRRTGGPKPEGGRSKPFGQPRQGGGFGGGDGGASGFNFGDFDMGNMFGGSGPRGGGPSRKKPRQSAPKPKPPPPRPKPKRQENVQWRVLSVQKSDGRSGAKVELITRERDLPGTPMVQVEILERTCYKAQVQCQEEVIERKRRRKNTEL